MTDGTVRLTGYHDVVAALQHPSVQPYGTPKPSEASGRAPRDTTAARPSPDLHDALAAAARTLWTAAHADFDVVSSVAMPFGARCAALSLGMTREDVAAAAPWAERAWMAAARARHPAPDAVTYDATVALMQQLGPSGAWQVQAIVAITHTLPALIGNVVAWLLDRPDALETLRASPPPARRRLAEELLRVVGPARVVYRQVAPWAESPVVLGGATLTPGDVLALDLAAANHDPAVFPEPEALRPQRVAPHLAFGLAPHPCDGAGLMRVALAAFLDGWLDVVRAQEIVDRETDPTAVTMRYHRSLRAGPRHTGS